MLAVRAQRSPGSGPAAAPLASPASFWLQRKLQNGGVIIWPPSYETHGGGPLAFILRLEKLFLNW